MTEPVDWYDYILDETLRVNFGSLANLATGLDSDEEIRGEIAVPASAEVS